MITYPLALPTAKSVKTLTIRKSNVVGVTESPHSLARQVQDFGGQRWEAEFTLPAMQREDAEEWAAFFDALNGPEGTFVAGRPKARTARGAVAATPAAIVVDGAGQSGQSLAIRSATLVNVPGLMLRGDQFQIGVGLLTRLYSVIEDADMLGGEAVLSFWPALRASPADGAAIVVASALGLWSLVTSAPEFDEDEAGIMRIPATAIREPL
jgi:hypothetical protein